MFRFRFMKIIFRYAVFAPNRVIPGEIYVLNILFTKELSDVAVTTVTVGAEFQVAGMDAKSENVIFQGQELAKSVRFEFVIPKRFLASTEPEEIWLKIQSSGHISFAKQTAVNVQNVQGQIYIQMDKPIYRAGDKIRFIAFGMYNNILPILDLPMNISLQVSIIN